MQNWQIENLNNRTHFYGATEQNILYLIVLFRFQAHQRLTATFRGGKTIDVAFR